MSSGPVDPRPPARSVRLGPLEVELLEQLWTVGPHDVADMHRSSEATRRRSPNTIQSTLERLVRKRLAVREKVGRAFVYRARLTRAEWIAHQLDQLLPVDPASESTPLLASFVDIAERTGDRGLARLEALVRARRRARAGEDAEDGAEQGAEPGARKGDRSGARDGARGEGT